MTLYNEVRCALTMIRMNIRNSAELRGSFIAMIIGMMVNNMAFVIILLTFVHVAGEVNGWRAVDMLALSGFGMMSFGIVFSSGAGIKKLPQYVSTGAFDSILLSPKNVLLRTTTRAFDASAVGDVLLGFICFVLYGIFATPSAQQWVMLVVVFLLATTIFYAVVVMVYAVSFFFTDAFNVTRGFFQLFIQPSLQPGGLFQGALRAVYTYVIPALLVANVPTEIVRAMSWQGVAWLAVLTVVWYVLAVVFFRFALRRYESGGLMTFGM